MTIMLSSELSPVRAQWPLTAKILHLLQAATVIFQLIVGIWDMQKADLPLFSWHIAVGSMLIVVIVIEWVWLLATREGRALLACFFPVSRASWRAIDRDIRGLFSKRMPLTGPQPGLACSAHGMMLVSVTVVAVSGAILWTGILGWWSLSANGFVDLLRILRWGAAAVVLQLIVHVGIVLVHALLGDPLWGIFRLKQEDKASEVTSKYGDLEPQE